jgi:hypothetical protein
MRASHRLLFAAGIGFALSASVAVAQTWVPAFETTAFAPW